MEKGPTTIKTLVHYYKHLPKLHLTHKSLKTFAIASEGNPLDEKSLGYSHIPDIASTHKIRVSLQKQKQPKKQTVDCWIGDLAKTNTKTKKMHQIKQNNIHIPVLLTQTLQYLDPQEGDSYLDLTAGYGGHAGAILERTKNPEAMTLVDRDQTAIDNLQETFGKAVDLRHSDFLAAVQTLVQEGKQFDIILADLGVSSLHLDIASRGFAFMQSGPLDMRMDQSQSLTAEQIVNTYDQEQLAEILRKYGEEPKAKRIARLIAENRPITTTDQLATIVAKAYPGRSRTHPATRTFQALRIAVNDELGQIQQALPLMAQLLAPGGRLGIISFHSLEDRIVKQAFKELAGDRYDAELRLATKKPIVGDNTEIVFNPRARSAKLRVAVKIKTKERETHANSG